MTSVRIPPFVLALAFMVGCAHAARPVTTTAAPLFVPPLDRPSLQGDSSAVRFGDGAAPPSGCFGISRRTGAVACVLGQFGVRKDSGERHLALLQSSDDVAPDIPIRVRASEGGLRLETESRRTLDTIMREGDFVELGAATPVPLDSPRSFGGITVELRRASTSLSEELPPDARVFDLKVIVQADARDGESKDEVLLENTLTSVACSFPTLTVRVLEPRVVLVERECRLDDGDEPELLLGAWLCDSERARCD